MTRFFNKLFNVRSDEWPRLAFLYLMVFVALVGFGWGEAIVEASFLRQVGVQYLPLAITGNAIVSILAALLYASFADRIANDRLLIGLIVVSLLCIAAGLVFLQWGLVFVTFPLLYMVLNVPLRDIFNVHWATYVNGFYDTRAAKRIIPLVGAGARVAGIVAGLTMPLLNTWLPPAGIIFLWLLGWGTMSALAWYMPRVLHDRAPVPEQRQTRAAQDPVEHIREGYRFVSQSPFLRWMAVSTFVMMVLLAFINYQTGKVLATELGTVEQIANFTAMLNGLGNLVALPFQLLFLSRLIGSVGLGNSALMFPLTTVASAASLIGFPGLASAGFGYLDRSILRTTLRNPIDSLLANAVPLRVRARARAFIGGLIMPLGSLIGGLLLAWANQIGDTGITLMAAAVVGFSALYLFSAWVTRRQYAQALVAMLEQEDYSFLLSQEASDLTLTDPTTLSRLKEKMDKPGASPELTIFVAQLMTQVGGDAALPLLGQAARAATDPRVRAGMLDVLAASDIQSSALAQLYTDFLADPEGVVRQSALAGLEELAGKTGANLAPLAVKMLDDPDQDVRLRSLLITAKSGGLDAQPSAARKLDEFLKDESPQRRAQGVRVLAQGCGKGGPVCSMERLAGFLRDPSDQVRLEAALAVEAVSSDALSGSLRAADYSTAISEAMTALLQDPVERIRQAALVVLGRIGTAAVRPSLVDAIADPSPQVCTTAADVLARQGKSVIPLVHTQLESPNPKQRKMAAVVLSRINPREFGPVVIGTHITGNLLAIYRNIGRVEALTSWGRYASIGAIAGALREQNQQLLDEILYLLTAIHSPASVKIIADSLHSDDPRTRANAVEALEALTTPQTTRLIAPLFEPESSPAELLRLSQSTWEMQHPDPCGVIFQLAADQDDWLRAMLAFALGELGSDVRKGSQPEALTITGLQVEALVQTLTADPAQDVKLAAQAAQRKVKGEETSIVSWEGKVLSTVEKVIFLKEVPFFQGMTIEQLKVLANVCEETFAPAETRLFVEGDSGGTLYVVVSGRVAIEQEKRKGSFARISTIEAHSYFGEMSLFDNSPHSTVATTLQDTLLLLIRREPLMALIRQHPELSLELIKVLNARLREANARVAELTRTRPRELHKLFDQLS